MPSIRISRYRPSHLKHILEIESAAFGAGAYPADLFVELASECPELFLVARHGLRIAGYMITCVSRGAGEVVSLAVHPDYRRRGIAKALMDYTLDGLRAARVKTVRLMARTDNAPAISFYSGFGFRRVRTAPGYYEDGSAGLSMRKQL